MCFKDVLGINVATKAGGARRGYLVKDIPNV